MPSFDEYLAVMVAGQTKYFVKNTFLIASLGSEQRFQVVVNSNTKRFLVSFLKNFVQPSTNDECLFRIYIYVLRN